MRVDQDLLDKAEEDVRRDKSSTARRPSPARATVSSPLAPERAVQRPPRVAHRPAREYIDPQPRRRQQTLQASCL